MKHKTRHCPTVKDEVIFPRGVGAGVGSDKGVEPLRNIWLRKRIPTTVLLCLFWVGAVLAVPGWAQQTEQETRVPPASTAQTSEPREPSQPNEELIEVERETPFGIQRFRIRREELTPELRPVQPAQPPAGPAAAPAAVATPQTVPTPPSPQTPAAQQEPPPAGLLPTAGQTPEPTSAQLPQAAEAVPIALHLENADLMQVIGIIAAELKINYVVDPEVTGTVNINTLGEVRRADLFPLLQMILRINGATAVQTGNFYRIVPLKEVQRLPIEPLLDPASADLPPDDRMVMNVIPLKYFSAADMTKILTPFLSEGGHLFSLEQGNILILTDSSQSMKRLLGLVGLLDSETFTGQRVRLYPVQNSDAPRLASELEKIFAAYALSEQSSGLRFLPLERINSILVVAANPIVFPEVETWLQRLDQPRQEAGVRTFIYKVENGKATDLASVLAELLGLSAYAPSTAATAQAGQVPSMTPGAIPAQRPTTPGAIPLAGFAPEPTHIRIVADSINNQLVIQATAQEYEQIRQTLQDLDIVPRQVMIEAKVYEVDLTGALSAGVSAFLQNRTEAERKPLASFGAPSPGETPSLSATLGTLVGKTRELLLFLNAAQSRSQARVISAPSILATDNLTASLSVGTEVPLLTSQALVGGAQAQGTNLFTNTIQNRDTGVLLTIIPRINSSGLVNLQIQQEVSAPLPPTGAIASPSIQKRSISTQVVVHDRETIALGGIIQESRTLSRNRIPLLGDIPYLGVLFGNTSLSTQRTELIILLTPTVIRDRSEAQRASAEFRDKLRELRKILEEDEKEEAKRQQERKVPPGSGDTTDPSPM
ncbi:MAG: type II secretion system secretin GspD [Acidobacteria bacterium]|nr:type II secretion system secretin GspD [Acidobacteriota bacterium]